jgi:Na+/proline symporter
LNDTAQFLVQFIVGTTMITAVAVKLGGFSGMLHSFSNLPATHVQPFHEPYTMMFAFIFLLINFLSYNGGTWHLAVRFIASPSGSEARKAALLSSALYLLWPIILFTPLCLAPLLIPGLANPEHSYITLAKTFLPAGLVGLVLAGLFANTMAMTSTDSTTLTAVITRDILPRIHNKISSYDPKKSLILARVTTFLLTLSTIIVAVNIDKFGGVFGMIVAWYGGMLGPISIPMILGFMPAFKRCGPAIAIASILAGLVTFALLKIFFAGQLSKALEIGMPGIVSFLIYASPVLFNRKKPVTDRIKDFFISLE